MSGYNINRNPANFKYDTIYTQIAPNSTLNLLDVNNIEISGSIYSATGPVVVNDDLTVNGNINVVNETLSNLTVNNDATIGGELITPLGNVDTLLDGLELQAGFGQTLASNATLQANLQPFFDSFMSYDGKGAFIHGGNIHTGQTFFCSTGVRNSLGQSFNANTFLYHGSAGKLVTGLVCTKMIEEGLINPSDFCGTYWPIMNGTGTYFTSITVTNPATFPYDPTSYTGATGAFNWGTVTITDLLHFNIGLLPDIFSIPPSNLFFQDPAVLPAVLAANAALPNPAGLASMLQYAFYSTQLGSGIARGPASAFVLGTQCPISNGVCGEDMITLNKLNVVPLQYAPGTQPNGYLPAAARVYPAQYDTGMFYLGMVLDYALRSKGYPNGYAQYLREKFITPMGLNTIRVANQESLQAQDYFNAEEVSFRRSPSLGLTQVYNILNPATWGGYGCDPNYRTAAGLSGQGPHVWRTQYPNDSCATISDLAKFGVGSSSAYPFANGPILGSIADFGAFLQLMCNKGVYNGVRYITPESWAYMTSTKISALSTPQQGPYPTTAGGDWYDTDFCMGFGKTPRDFNYNTTFGVSDENSYFWAGIQGTLYLFDTYTGNWFYGGQTQSLYSSGAIGVFPPYPPFGSDLNRELAIKGMIKN